MGNAQPQQPFTILNERQLRGLAECGASGREVLAYAMLARYHDADGTCNANAAESAAALGIDEMTLIHALGKLARKTFTARDGNARPVIIRKPSPAHRGRNAEWIDALFLDSMEPAALAAKGERTHAPIDGGKVNELMHLTPAKGERTHAPIDGGKVHQSMPKGASIDAERCINRCTHKNKEERKIFTAEDDATQAPRAALAAEGPTPDRGTGEGSRDAPTMEPPTLAEWQRLESLLQYGPLSPTDEARRAAGAARYIPAPPRPAPRREGAA